MIVITLDHEIVITEVLDVINILPSPLQFRKELWLPLQLFFQSLDMIFVDVCVSYLYYEFVCVRARNPRNHVGKEGIGSNVERDSKAKVCRSLEHETGKLRLFCGVCCRWGEMDVELTQQMTGREGHLGHVYTKLKK